MKRLVAQELTLSFVPDVEQRLWRTVMRRKYQVTRNRVQLQNRLEALLEEAHIKVSSLVSDLDLRPRVSPDRSRRRASWLHPMLDYQLEIKYRRLGS